MMVKEQIIEQPVLDSWKLPGCAKIVNIDTLIDEVNRNYIVCASGGFDPIHPGHLSYITESKNYNKILVVIVNGDWFLKNKKGKSFQDLKTRCQVVSAIKQVDYVVPFEIEGDKTVSVALEQIRPYFFTKGGDRVDKETIPEWEACDLNEINVVTGVGQDKFHSSSKMLDNWGKYYLGIDG